VIKRRAEGTPVKSPDGALVYEVLGLRPTGTGELSVALAVVKPGEATVKHRHDFTEVYLFVEGEGVVHVGEEAERVIEGDCVLIPRGEAHYVENVSRRELRFWCICTPSFTEEGTQVVERPGLRALK